MHTFNNIAHDDEKSSCCVCIGLYLNFHEPSDSIRTLRYQWINKLQWTLFDATSMSFSHFQLSATVDPKQLLSLSLSLSPSCYPLPFPFSPFLSPPFSLSLGTWFNPSSQNNIRTHKQKGRIFFLLQVRSHVQVYMWVYRTRRREDEKCHEVFDLDTFFGHLSLDPPPRKMYSK